jgi:hypothetical protein
MEIENLTPEVGSLKIEEGVAHFNLGNIVRKASKSFTLLFKGKVHKSIQVGCPACTKANLNPTPEGLEMKITYTALDSRGQITKSATETFSDDTKQTIKFTINII